MTIKWLEPLPSRFFCPLDQASDWQKSGYTVLGNTILSAGGSYYFIVRSAPCCPLFWGNGKAEPDKIQSAWLPKDMELFRSDPIGYSGKWKKSHGNYLAYWVSLPNSNRTWLMTVRWVSPSK